MEIRTGSTKRNKYVVSPVLLSCRVSLLLHLSHTTPYLAFLPTRAAISKYPKFSYAFVLGSCTIWSMHFIGMQAVVLENVDMCYSWLPTLMSLFLSVTGVWLGVTIASYDIFAGDDRVETLKHLLRDNQLVTSKMNRSKASMHIHIVALFSKLHWIAAGSVLAALGALSMHYVGMIAMQGPFRREWSIPYVGGSVLVGCVVAFAGFWILFRPL